MQRKNLKLKNLQQDKLKEYFLELLKQNKVENKKVVDALGLVITLHKNQSRPDGPYINHLIRVATRCLLLGVIDSEVIIAALLHDSIEDQKEKLCEMFPNLSRCADSTEKAYDIISSLYSERVSNIIKFLTNPIFPNGLKSDEFNMMYLEHIKTTLSKDDNASIIKLSDFYDNGMDLIESNASLDQRKKWSKKYLPLFDLFIQKINYLVLNNAISKDIAEQVIFDLIESKKNTQTLVNV